jgi:hypothetical protein
MKKAAWMMVAALALAARPGHAQTITCGAPMGGRSYCATGKVAGVNLIQELDAIPCVRGTTWGFTSEGVWVTGGCRALFELIPEEVPAGSGSFLNGGSRFVGRSFSSRWDHRGPLPACEHEVRRLTNSSQVSTHEESSSSLSEPRVSWTASSGLYGTCRLSRAERSLLIEVQGQR